MKYRILKTTDRAGIETFYIQRKQIFWWVKVRKEIGMNFYIYTAFGTEQEARDWITKSIENYNNRKLHQTIKKEIINQ